MSIPVSYAMPSGSTPSGLPYPTVNDKLSLTADYIQALAAAADQRLANSGTVIGRADVTVNGADGRGWLVFPTLAALYGLAVHPYRGDVPIWPTVVQLTGNQGLVQFRFPTVGGYSAAISNYGGTLNCSYYAWGQPV